MKTRRLHRAGTGALLVVLIAGCTATTPAPSRVGVAPSPVVASQPRAAGLVVGQTARELETAFGPPRAALTEGAARRLQFVGTVCVLDAYLYPQRSGEPAVTHIDTRRPTGEDIDRAVCVAALRAERATG